jgi:hypothetical protein
MCTATANGVQLQSAAPAGQAHHCWMCTGLISCVFGVPSPALCLAGLPALLS